MDEVKMTKNFIIKDCDQINNQFRYFNIIDFISIFQLNFSKNLKIYQPIHMETLEFNA